MGAVIDCLRNSQNFIFTGATGSETDLPREKLTAGLHGFGNAGKTLLSFHSSPCLGRVRIAFEISEEFFPLCLARLLRKLTNFGACFEVLNAVFHYRPPEIFDSGAEL